MKEANSSCLQWLVNFSDNRLGAWDPKSWQTWDHPSRKGFQGGCGEPVASRDPPWALQLELKAELVGSNPGSIIYWARVDYQLFDFLTIDFSKRKFCFSNPLKRSGKMRNPMDKRESQRCILVSFQSPSFKASVWGVFVLPFLSILVTAGREMLNEEPPWAII